MKFKSLILFNLGLIFPTTNVARPINITNKTQELKENVVQQVKRLANSLNEEETNNSEEILCQAIDNYKNEFHDYINITGLNVLQKDLINLPNFDSTYVAPTFGEVMYNYQTKLEKSLSILDLNKYEQLRIDDLNFDRYVALNSNKYLNLKVRPKYDHPATIAVVTTTLLGILSSAGLEEAAITAFTGAVSTLSSAISTSWIPFIGWALAVALAAGALIALTVIIVQYWDEIHSVINEIKSWFLEQFSAFTNLINNYFSDAIAQGETSTVAEVQVIDGQEIVWEDAHMTRDVAISISTDLQRNKNDVLLMKNITFPRQNEMNWWIPTSYVSVDFVISNKLCQAPYYFSTYTWYNDTAKRMLYEAAPSYSNWNGFGYKNLVYHQFTHMKRAVYGWNHYHVGRYNPISEEAETYGRELQWLPIRKVHSFFGLAYVRLSNQNGFVGFPGNVSIQ